MNRESEIYSLDQFTAEVLALADEVRKAEGEKR